MQTTPKTRSGSSEVPQKVSPRARRQLRPTALDTESVSSLSPANKISKERSPKVTDRRSPRSPVPERKRPSKISELESQISKLQEDLKVVRDQLIISESCKKQAQQDAAESKEQLLALSAKLKDSQKQLLDLSATGEARATELPNITEEQHDSTNCEIAQSQHAESEDDELLNLKQNLSETLSLVENMKNQLRDCKESESQAQALANETSLQLEDAKKTVELLSADNAKAVDGYKSIALQLDESRARVNSLEALVTKLEADRNKFEPEVERLKQEEDPSQIEAEIFSLKSEIGRLKSVAETVETKYQEEQIRSTVQIRNAYELMEQIKAESSQREHELEAELKRRKAYIEELKANLMDKETELQGIMEENENLNSKLSQNDEHGLKMQLKRLDEHVAELKAEMMDKETTLQSITEENETLKSEIKRFSEGAADVEAAKDAEREALVKLGIVMEEADRSNRKAARVAEQLEAAQEANSEMEAELRKLKVQSDQWRKAAEAAAAMLSAGGNNGKLITERTVSLEKNYKCSPFAEDMDDDDEFQRKKNGNVLKKIGVLWKKPQK